jgi:hypothetical protein
VLTIHAAQIAAMSDSESTNESVRVRRGGSTIAALGVWLLSLMIGRAVSIVLATGEYPRHPPSWTWWPAGAIAGASLAYFVGSRESAALARAYIPFLLGAGIFHLANPGYGGDVARVVAGSLVGGVVVGVFIRARSLRGGGDAASQSTVSRAS